MTSGNKRPRGWPRWPHVDSTRPGHTPSTRVNACPASNRAHPGQRQRHLVLGWVACIATGTRGSASKGASNLVANLVRRVAVAYTQSGGEEEGRDTGGEFYTLFLHANTVAPCDILRDNGAHPKADRHARHPCTHRSASMSQLGPRSLARHERAQRARTLTRTPLSHSPPPRPTRSPSLHISPTAARAQKVHDREHQPCSPGAFSRSRSPARTLSTTKSPPPAASSHRSPTRGSAAAVSQRAVDGSGRGAERSRVESTRVRVAWRGVA